ncbi:MAG TPA: antibiotic biosynthesis monooxygenase [Bacteroidia bacterium]|nr:antibiotic biosynthesis monooxygenase [Bacteroidia bacterium]
MEATKKRTETSEQILIDKLTVPPKARQEVIERMNMNRNLIKKLPGFIKDKVYEGTDENGNLIFITIAVWESSDAIKKAKEVVQIQYQAEGFNLQDMLERLNILFDRGIYKNADTTI